MFRLSDHLLNGYLRFVSIELSVTYIFTQKKNSFLVTVTSTGTEMRIPKGTQDRRGKLVWLAETSVRNAAAGFPLCQQMAGRSHSERRQSSSGRPDRTAL